MSDAKPNIVLIVVDQWRADCIGFLGNPYVDTPNIDRIFAQGTAFRQAYSAVPTCIAARAALLTGMCQTSHGRVGYRDGVPWTYEHTLPGTLAQAGYHTHCVGKMHVSPARNLLGFHSVELHDGYLHFERKRKRDYGMVDDYLPWLREQAGSHIDMIDCGVGCNGYSVSPWTMEERLHPTNWVTTQSIDFLRRRDPQKPFFLKVSYHRPHPPLDPPKHYLDRYLNRDLPPVEMGDWVGFELGRRSMDAPVPTTPAQIDLARRAYYAQLTHIDAQLNRLVHALNEHEVLNDTMIIFVSDHGEILYDHNMIGKASGLDASARVPFMVRFPTSMSTPIAEVSQPVELRDIMPTCLDLVGVEIPQSVDGCSVLPLCRGEETSWREFIHGEHSYGQASNHWINTGKEMYTWLSQTAQELYFDLEDDPKNSRNLADQKPERVEALRKHLIAELTGREEGYVQDGRLVVGQATKAILDCVFQGDPSTS